MTTTNYDITSVATTLAALMAMLSTMNGTIAALSSQVHSLTARLDSTTALTAPVSSPKTTASALPSVAAMYHVEATFFDNGAGRRGLSRFKLKTEINLSYKNFKKEGRDHEAYIDLQPLANFKKLLEKGRKISPSYRAELNAMIADLSKSRGHGGRIYMGMHATRDNGMVWHENQYVCAMLDADYKMVGAWLYVDGATVGLKDWRFATKSGAAFPHGSHIQAKAYVQPNAVDYDDADEAELVAAPVTIAKAVASPIALPIPGSFAKLRAAVLAIPIDEFDPERAELSDGAKLLASLSADYAAKRVSPWTA